ncbi:hypothetical protein BDY24DRAFT_392721 [Mrakia frigida]|uniref:uncharacterized protein n=1 Tax=Mrakia frigida TaxID=29902 RepID=UPI003FCC00AE
MLLPFFFSVAATAALSLSSAASAALLEGSIVFNQYLPDISSIQPSTSISLDHGAKHAYVLRDGSFRFSDVEPGLHTLQVLSASHSFQDLVITIPPASPPTTSSEASPSSPPPFVAIHAPSAVLPFDPLSPPSVGSLPYPLQLVPLGKLNFYTEQGSFQIFTMLKSPMILMMMASGVMMLALPWLLKNMDPEALTEANKLMAGGPGKLTSLPTRPSSSSDDAGAGDVVVTPPYSPAVKSTGGGGGKGGKGGGGGGKKKK